MSGTKRKWDSAPEDPADVAKAAVSKIQAQLAAQGVEIRSVPKQELPSREVEINDSSYRMVLTKGTTHEEIFKLTGAAVITKGRYKPPGDTSSERPLHLLVTGETPEIVDRAVDYIQKVLAGKIVPESAEMHHLQHHHHQQQRSPMASYQRHLTPFPFETKVFVGLEKDEAVQVGFNLIGKLLGQGGQFIRHIANTTGAKVLLKGRYVSPTATDGSARNFADEPLHIFVGATSKPSLDGAKALAENLVETVRKEWNDHRAQKSGGPRRGHGPGTGYRGPPSYNYQNTYPNSYQSYSPGPPMDQHHMAEQPHHQQQQQQQQQQHMYPQNEVQPPFPNVAAQQYQHAPPQDSAAYHQYYQYYYGYDPASYYAAYPGYDYSQYAQAPPGGDAAGGATGATAGTGGAPETGSEAGTESANTSNTAEHSSTSNVPAVPAPHLKPPTYVPNTALEPDEDYSRPGKRIALSEENNIQAQPPLPPTPDQAKSAASQKPFWAADQKSSSPLLPKSQEK